MATSSYKLSKFLFKIIILTYCGHVLTRSIPSRNVHHHNTPAQFPYPLSGSLPVQPIFYNPIPQVYQHHIEPTGTFYDRKRGILRSFPGGGIPLLVDYQKRCSNNYIGIKPHPHQRQHYYVCKPDCVVFGKCQNLQAFDATKGQCTPYPQPEYAPICKKPGRYPVSADCTTYYRCDSHLRPQIFSCPQNTVFSPQHGKCVGDYKCSPTMVSPYGTYIPQESVHKFPPCIQDGIFRTPTDCSLYYTCAIQPNRIYLQTRYRCPELTFYDPTLGVCRPQHEVACDAIQLSELVLPRQPIQARLPSRVYPPHYSMDSLEDNDISTENSMSKEESLSASVSSNEDSFSTEINNEVIGSSREKIGPLLPGVAQNTTELAIPFNTLHPTTPNTYPTTTPSAIPTDYTTLNSFVGTEHPLYTKPGPTDNLLQYYPNTQITLPPTDRMNYEQFSHHDGPNSIKNTLDETELRNVRASATQTGTPEELFTRRKGHLNIEDFKGVIDAFNFDTDLPITTQSPLQHRLTDYNRQEQTTQKPNKYIPTTIRNDIGSLDTTPIPLDQHEGVTIIIEELEGVRHDMQSNEILDDLSYYDDDAELDEVIPSTLKPNPADDIVLPTQSTSQNVINPNVLPKQLNSSEPSSGFEDSRAMNNVASQLPSPLISDETKETAMNPSNDPSTTKLAEEELDKVNAAPEIPHPLEDENAPQERSTSPVEPAAALGEGVTLQEGANQPTTNLVQEKFDAAVEDPETAAALAQEAGPQQIVDPTVTNLVREGANPPTTNLVREKLDATDEDPETADALAEKDGPQQIVDPTVTNLVRDKLDEDPETAAVLEEESLPQEGGEVLPQEGVDPSPTILGGEKLDAADASILGEETLPQEGVEVLTEEGADLTPTNPEPETAGVLGAEVLPQEEIVPMPTNLDREKPDAADKGPETAAALGDKVLPQEGVDPTPANGDPETVAVLRGKTLPQEGVDPTPTKEDPETAAVLGEEILPQEGVDVSPQEGVDPTPINLVREKLDVGGEAPETADALGEGVVPQEVSSPSFEEEKDPSMPIALTEDSKIPPESEKEEIAATDAISPPIEPPSLITEKLDDEIPPTLGEENLPPKGYSSPVEPPSLIQEKLDAEIPSGLGGENVPTKGSSPPIEPPSLTREKLDAEIPSGLEEENVPPKGPSSSIEPPSLVREKLDAEIQPALGEENLPTKGSSPPIEPPSLTREKLDAEIPSGLGGENVPTKGSSPPIEPPSLTREKLDAEIPSGLEEENVPPKGPSPSIEPPSLVREKLDAEIQPALGEENLPTKGSSPPIDPPSLTREKLDAEIPSGLGGENVPTKGSSPPIEPPSLTREKLDAEIPSGLGGENVPPKGPSPSIEPPSLVREKLDAEIQPALGEENVPTKGSSPPIEPPSLTREKLDAEIPSGLGGENVPTKGSSPPIEPPSLTREKLDAEIPSGLEEENVPPKGPSSSIEPPSLVREKLDAEIQPALGEENLPTKGSSPPIEPPSLTREKLDAEIPSGLGGENVPTKESSPPIEPPSLPREKLDAEIPSGLGGENVPTKGSSPPIEPPSLTREKLDAEIPSGLGGENVPPKGPSPSIEPPSLVREKLDAEIQPALGEENLPTKGSSPPIEPPSLTREKLDAEIPSGLEEENVPPKASTDEQIPFELDDKSDPQEGSIVPPELEERSVQNSAIQDALVLEEKNGAQEETRVSSELEERSLQDGAIQDAQIVSNTADPVSNKEVNQPASSTDQAIVEPTAAKSWPTEESVTNSFDVAMYITTKPTTIAPSNEINTLPDWHESEMYDPQTRVAKSVTSTRDMLNALPSEVAIDRKTKSKELFVFGEKKVSPLEDFLEAQTERNFESPAEVQKEQDSTSSPSTVTEPTNEITTSKAIETTEQSIHADMESTTMFLERETNTTDISSTNSLAIASSTKGTSTGGNAPNESFEERLEIPASMENEISTKADQPVGQDDVSTSGNRSPTEFELTNPSISSANQKPDLHMPIAEPEDDSQTKKANIESLDSLIMDIKASTLRPIRNAAMENGFEPDNQISNLIDVGEHPTVKAFEDNDQLVIAKNSPLSAENFMGTSTPQAPIVPTSEGDTINSTNQPDSRDIEGSAVERSPAPALRESTEAGAQESGEVFNKEISSEAPPRSSTETEKTETTTNSGNVDMPTTSEQTRRGFQSDGTDPLIPGFVSDDESNDWSTKQTFDESFTAVLEFTTEGIVEGSSNILLESSVNDHIVDRDDSQIEDAHVRVVKEAMHPPPKQRGIKLNTDMQRTVERHTQPTESLESKFEFANKGAALSDEREIPADALERATGLIRIADDSPNLFNNVDNSLLPTSNTFLSTNPATDPINEVNEIPPKGIQDIPRTDETINQTPSELVPIPQPTTTITFTKTTAQEPPTAENTETGTTQASLRGLELEDSSVPNSSDDNIRIVRYTNDANQYPQAIKRVYRPNPVPNSNSQIVTEDPINATDIPKMEVVVFGDLDLSVLFCANECNSTHEHKYGTNAFGEQHAVGVQWDPVNSNKTMSLVTV